MNIAFFAVPDLLAPLQVWVRKLVPTGTAGTAGTPVRASQPTGLPALPSTQSALVPAMVRRPSRLAALPALAQPAARALRPLRVVQVMERGASRANAGRMVISGRMADVCAELDRLAAREATLH